MDLDASIAFFRQAQVHAKVFYSAKEAKDAKGLVYAKHNGDARADAGEGDDETIDVNLSQVPADLNAIGISITSYKQLPFTAVRDVYVRVLAGGLEVARYPVSNFGASSAHTACILAFITRGDLPHNSNSWRLTAAGPISGYGKSVSYTTFAMEGWLATRPAAGRQRSQPEHPEVRYFQTPANATRKVGFKAT